MAHCCVGNVVSQAQGRCSLHDTVNILWTVSERRDKNTTRSAILTSISRSREWRLTC